MDRNVLPRSVVDEDRALETQANNNARSLVKLRWHWTLDDGNPGRVSMNEYARAVGANRTLIQRDAHAYELLTGGHAVGVNDARERAAMGTETAVAVAAVADTHGVSLSTARKSHKNKARRVREMARQRAEEKGTTTTDEIPAVAAWMRKAEVADEEAAAQRKAKHSVRYVKVEASLLKARQHLLNAARESESVEFTAEERELLRDTVAHVKRLLALVDRAIADAYDKSWQSELRVLEGGRAS